MARQLFTMSEQAFMPLFFGDLLKQTLFWSGEERALCMLLMAAQWYSGPLPTSLATLATAIAYDETKLRALWNSNVRKHFIETPQGYVNEELERHRQRVARKSERLSEAGRKGGHATRARTTAVQASPQAKPQASPGAGLQAELQASPQNCLQLGSQPGSSNPIQSNPTQSRPNHSGGNTDSSPHALADQPATADPPPAATARKTGAKRKRIPQTFDTEPFRAWSAENTPGIDFDEEIATLRDHEFRDAHSDWDAVVRNWLRRAYKAAKQRKPNGGALLTRYERLQAQLTAADTDEHGNSIPF
jgi:uncharacterized protein YdaU (DUF1376 family)